MKAVSKTDKPDNAFAGLGDMLAAGFDTGLMSTGAQRQMFKLADIEVEEQVRSEMENEEQSIADLAESMREKIQIAPVLLRKNRPGRVKPFLLVVGGRRFLSAEHNQWDEIWGDYHPEMTDEQADGIQFAENVQRKNLTQIEEARRVQKDLDTLGSVEAVLAKHNKANNRAWLSKLLSLLRLPEQAKRLVSESISADVEVINTVKTIEKHSPEKAKALVEDLKATRGKSNAREKAQAVKDEVKPKKDKPTKDAGGSKATARDRSQEEPSQGDVFASEKMVSHVEALSRAYVSIFEAGKAPKAALEAIKWPELEAVENYLHTFYEAGKQATDAARVVIEGFRNGGFASDGVGAFALVAYLHGTDASAKFNLLNVFGSLKP